MSRRNRSGRESTSESGGSNRGGIGQTVKRIIKIKLVLLGILIILAFFGVLYLVDWVRGLFSSDASMYLSNHISIVEIGDNAATLFADFDDTNIF